MVQTYVLNDFDIASLIFGFCGVVFFAVGVPLFMQIVKPNWIYGCRTKRTLNNEQLWYKVNRRGGRNFMLAGIVLTKAAAGLYLLRPPWSGDKYTLVLLGIMIGAMALATLDTFRYERNGDAKQLRA